MIRPDVTRVRTAGGDNRSHSLTPLAVPLLLKPRPLAQPLPAPLRYQHLLEGVEVLNAFARAEHD